MQRINLALTRRTETGKGPNRRLRSSGQIPAVIYGAEKDPEKAAVNGHDFERLLSTTNIESALISLDFGAGSNADENTAVIREMQRDPVTRRVLHVDFYRVRMDVESDFEVPVRGVGIPVGVREGGILETHLRSVEIRCLPTLLPTSFDVDLSEMKVNTSIHIRDLKLADGIELLSDGDQVLFTVLAAKEQAVAAPVEGEEVAQPEVIGKKKEEGEGEAEKEKK